MADQKTKEPELTPREAAMQYARAVKDDPNDAQAHLNLGSAYYAAGNLDAAFNEFQDALRISPGLDHAHYYLGVLYAKRGDKDQARQEWQWILNGGEHTLLKNQAEIQLEWLGK